MLDIPKERVIVLDGEPAIFSSALLMTELDVCTMLEYRGAFFLVRDSLLRLATNHNGTPQRIWMDRSVGASPGRELINADEVHSLVMRYGFGIVDMAAHSIRDQIAIAGHARVMAGPHGAAFVHATFMEPRSTAIECYSPGYLNTAGCTPEICSLLGHRWFMCVPGNAFGIYPYGEQLKVDCFQLELLLQSLDL